MGMEAPIKAGDVPVPADLAELRNYVSLCSDGPGLANSCSNCRSAVAIGCDVGAAGCTAAICKFSGGSLCFFAGPVCAGIARWGCNPQRVCEFIGYCSSETDELVALEVAAAEEHQQAANDLETAILTASRSCGECSRRECVPSCTPPYDTSSRCRSCLQNCGCRVSSTTEDFVAAVGIVMKTPAAAEDVALEIAAAAEHQEAASDFEAAILASAQGCGTSNGMSCSRMCASGRPSCCAPQGSGGACHCVFC